MGAWQEIADYTWTANETSRTFTGLNITKDDFVKVVFTFSITASASVALFPNTTSGVSGYNNNSNYYLQQLEGASSSVIAGSGNLNRFAFAATGTTVSGIGYVKISEGNKYNSFTTDNRTSNSNIGLLFYYNTSTITFPDAITSLTFTASATNAIGTGSRIQIYKLAATKVADITVASNTTQVDISNLSIDKDSEYLLVSDMASTSQVRASLTFNDAALDAQWYQAIRGNGTTADAFRGQLSAMMNGSSVNAVLYTHIKLSNIGAITAQNYGLGQAGTSSVYILNYFNSTIAENITSINKISIGQYSGTAQYAPGSRFTLYKLY